MAMHAVDPPSRFNRNQAPKAYAWTKSTSSIRISTSRAARIPPSSILSRGSAMMSHRVVASDASTRRRSWSWPACNIAWLPIDPSSLFGLHRCHDTVLAGSASIVRILHRSTIVRSPGGGNTPPAMPDHVLATLTEFIFFRRPVAPRVMDGDRESRSGPAVADGRRRANCRE
jgi:hypothetical protein